MLAEFLVHPLECALAASVIVAGWFLCDRAAAFLVPGETWWVRGNTTSGTLALLGLVCLVALFTARRIARAPERLVERSLAALVWFALAALAALFFLPGASFVFSGTLLFAAPSALIILAAEFWWRRPSAGLGAVLVWLLVAGAIGIPAVNLASRAIGARRENLALNAQGR